MQIIININLIEDFGFVRTLNKVPKKEFYETITTKWTEYYSSSFIALKNWRLQIKIFQNGRSEFLGRFKKLIILLIKINYENATLKVKRLKY